MQKPRFLIAAIISLFTGNIFADSNPFYQDEIQTLRIPTVDVAAAPGFYQDVVVEFFEDNKWRLVSGTESREVAEIEKVTLLQTDSAPVQVFLRIAGEFSNGCPEIGQISHRLVGNTFEVAVYYKNNLWLRQPELVLCAAVIVPFSRTIPLPVYGLPAGDYNYSLNGEFGGSFTLTTDNVLE